MNNIYTFSYTLVDKIRKFWTQEYNSSIATYNSEDIPFWLAVSCLVEALPSNEEGESGTIDAPEFPEL